MTTSTTSIDIMGLQAAYRSEERFSRNAETDLVCRLLLEKKKRDVLVLEDTVDGELPRELVTRICIPPLMVVRVHSVRVTEVVDIDGEEVEQVAVGRAEEAPGGDVADVVGLGAHLHAVEVRAGVERIHRLGEVDVPDLPNVDVRVRTAVRLVIDEVDAAGVTRDHPRENRRIIRRTGQVDRCLPVRSAVSREGVVNVLLAPP